MLTPTEFLEAAKWSGITVIMMAALTVLGFLLGWGIRFRLVGITGFTGVLTVGLFGLSFQPLTPTVVPGAIPYQTVYDSGAAQIALKVPNTVTEFELEATLKQAARNLLKPSRLGVPGQVPTIRARTLLHQEGGVSKLVYLGRVRPAQAPSADNPFEVTLNKDAFASLESVSNDM